MVHLSVNVDYIAVVRESRKTVEPDPVLAAGMVELAGAHGITAHLREDRRHIQDRDVRILSETVMLPFNLEMGGTEEMFAIACDIHPDQVTFVPEKRQEVTTEGGLDVIGNRERLADMVAGLRERRMVTSMFIDPVPAQIEMSREIGADCVELHTGEYANAATVEEAERVARELESGAALARSLGLEVHAGHGLTYKNIARIRSIDDIQGYYIGHSIMARSMYTGLDRAVRDMLALLV